MDEKPHFDLFVIGGGSAGVRCARISAKHGAKVAIAEASRWGGTCVNLGCVPKKLMVNACEYGQWAEESSAFGWTMTKVPSRPPLGCSLLITLDLADMHANIFLAKQVLFPVSGSGSSLFFRPSEIGSRVLEPE